MAILHGKRGLLCDKLLFRSFLQEAISPNRTGRSKIRLHVSCSLILGLRCPQKVLESRLGVYSLILLMKEFSGTKSFEERSNDIILLLSQSMT